MILTSNTRLTDRIAEWLGRRLARYLAQPVKEFVPLATADPGAFLRALRPGDIVLVEGNTRVSTAIKYLTQSTWSHSSPYVGPISGRSETRVNRMCWSRLPKVKARDGATNRRGKTHRRCEGALDDVKPCESVGIARVPTAAEAARSKS
jgi:hypothetical protein